MVSSCRYNVDYGIMLIMFVICRNKAINIIPPTANSTRFLIAVTWSLIVRTFLSRVCME